LKKAAQYATSSTSVVRREQYKKHNIQSGSFSTGMAEIDFSQVNWVGGFLQTQLSCIKACKISKIISNCSQLQHKNICVPNNHQIDIA